MQVFVGHDVVLPTGTKGRVQLRRYLPRHSTHTPFQVFNFYLVSGASTEAFASNALLLQSLLAVDILSPPLLGGT